MIVQSKITSKRQVTIPIRIMRKLGLNSGDTISFEDKLDHIEIIPMGKKFSALDLPKKFGKTTKITATQKDITKAREKSWSSRYKKYLKNNPK